MRVMSPALSSALLYAASSVGIMFVNKLALTSYGFSADCLALAQYAATVVILLVLKVSGRLDLPLGWGYAREVQPLPWLFMGNTLSGLRGTKSLSLPMFTVLRRFSIPCTMLLERYVFAKVAATQVQVSVFMMVLGAVIAAADDFAFDGLGYSYLFVNDLLTAANNVITKRKADTSLGEWGVLFYNALFTLPVSCFLYVVFSRDDLERVVAFPYWSDRGFVGLFLLSAVMGCVLQYATVACTKHNSALTTTVVGCLKNILTTYAGMLLSDWQFSPWNFVGVNVSIVGSFLYSYSVFIGRKPDPNLHAPPSPLSPPSASLDCLDKVKEKDNRDKEQMQDEDEDAASEGGYKPQPRLLRAPAFLVKYLYRPTVKHEAAIR
eukprot:TRINITY_DN18566_c0_g1_i1.p1 TRINITY_DN18566_c0_g1~~TRINITY_DN18566_c0_g1_i1.p1  ORF type:complete len:378 (+),score=71.52 TRINITY_DN18566_c0_g1_i1:115-1248(+)